MGPGGSQLFIRPGKAEKGAFLSARNQAVPPDAEEDCQFCLDRQSTNAMTGAGETVMIIRIAIDAYLWMDDGRMVHGDPAESETTLSLGHRGSPMSVMPACHQMGRQNHTDQASPSM